LSLLRFSEMDRRDFIKVTAASGATATLAGCGNPEHQLIRFIPEEPFYPGVATTKTSICGVCPAGCGVQVRVMDGDAEVVRNGQQGVIRMGLARKLEGNPLHPVSQGKLCARGQAAIQLTYHPDRIRQPLKRTGARGSSSFQPISWDEAMAEFVSRLTPLAASRKPGSLRFLSRRLRGQRDILISQFLNAFGGGPAITFEFFDDRVLREANARSFGYRQLPTFDLARSRYVISFGADFLGTWNSPVAHSVAYGEMRQGRPGIRAKFVQVEPRMSQTGANADEWVPAKPGTEGVLALGLAHVILKSKLRTPEQAGRAGQLIEGWGRGLPEYGPADVERRTGVKAARIEKLAREFAMHAPAVAIIGGAPLAHTNGTFQAVAVNALNALVGSVGTVGGIFFTPQAQSAPAQDPRGIREVAAEILATPGSPIELLLLYETNPVFGAPMAWRIREALEKIPYIVSFGSFIDETSILADLILPDHSFLESWVDHVPESGSLQSVVSVAAPAMRPLHQTRSMPEVLLDASRMIMPALQPGLPWKDHEEMLRSAFLELPEATPESWKTAHEQGGWWPAAAPTMAPLKSERGTQPTPLEELRFDGDPAQFPFHFLPYASQAFLDGSVSHLPWLQELPDVMSTAMWSAWVELNPKTAAALGVAQGNLVEITSSQGKIRVPALLSPGIAPDVVAMPVGQGHETFTRYASARGSNPIAILAPLEEKETGALAWAATRVRLSRVEGPAELVLFAGGMKEHDAEHR
jgi:menaquinone reductase, molybdopterin-binding-like subunit